MTRPAVQNILQDRLDQQIDPDAQVKAPADPRTQREHRDGTEPGIAPDAPINPGSDGGDPAGGGERQEAPDRAAPDALPSDQPVRSEAQEHGPDQDPERIQHQQGPYRHAQQARQHDHRSRCLTRNRTGRASLERLLRLPRDDAICPSRSESQIREGEVAASSWAFIASCQRSKGLVSRTGLNEPGSSRS